MWRDTSAIAYPYDEKIISETSVACNPSSNDYTEAGWKATRCIVQGPGGPLNGGPTASVREEGSQITCCARQIVKGAEANCITKTLLFS